jgi:hypothetical protein
MAVALVVAAMLFHLRDGRVVAAAEWLRHGDEYVVTAQDGRVLILRQQEIREMVPARSERGHAGRDEAAVPGR